MYKMNFNLIAKGEEKCQDFTVRFREPITIKENSEIKLNFVSFQRENVIDFTEDQTITFSVESRYVLPRVSPVAPFGPNTTALNGAVATIPKGKYSPLALRNKIETAIEEMTDNIGGGVSQYFPLAILDESQIPEQLTFGLYAEKSQTEFAIDAGNSALATTASAIGVAGSYVKDTGGTNGIYDSYALADAKYYHYFEDSQEAIFNSNPIVCNFIRDDAASPAPTGKITVGLYSLNYAVTSGFGANPNRTRGTTIQTFNSQQELAAYLTLEVDFSSPDFPLVIRVASDGGIAGRVYNWETQRTNITQMTAVEEINLSEFPEFAGALQPGLVIQTYYRNFEADNLDENESPRIYFRIYTSAVLNKSATNPGEALVFDSYRRNWFFRPEFFVNTQDTPPDKIQYDGTAKVRSQIPFNIIAAAQQEKDGIACNFPPHLEITNQESIIERYNMAFSEELAKCFDKSPSTNRRPNITPEEPFGAYRTFLSVNWLEDGYSVFMEGLPIRNFKNKEEQRDGGFAKAILANVPAPFGVTANIVNEAATSDTTALFQPTFPIVSQMKNNEMTVNSLNVKVVDMDTEKPATHLKKFVANFSITE